jgi:hypothetical protein
VTRKLPDHLFDVFQQATAKAPELSVPPALLTAVGEVIE